MVDTGEEAVIAWLRVHPEAVALVIAQDRDRRRARLRRSRREVRATDLGPDDLGQAVLDCGPDRRPSTLVGVSMTWDARHVSYVPKRMRCPACGDRLRGTRDLEHYCLCCSASSTDPTQHPAQAPAIVQPVSRLAGGRGRPARSRSGCAPTGALT